jgi:C_GCAxxG_C_C family probable redox protein
VGEPLLNDVSDQILRMSSGLGGGIGGTEQELCGAFSSGVLLIGALHGRTTPEEDDSYCAQLIVDYREHFIKKFKTTQCQVIRDQGYGAGGQWSCSDLVEWAATILMETLVRK